MCYPTIREVIEVKIEPEKYVAACDLSQLYELEIYLGKAIRKLEAEIQSENPDKDINLDLALKKQKVINNLFKNYEQTFAKS